MIFADKLIELRKSNRWTQEELAEKMEVSRQTITKWEGAVSIPELGKLVKLANLFDVSLDYLLRDEIEQAHPQADETGTDIPAPRSVSMQEANDYMDLRVRAAKPIALGTLLCILSPVGLILLCAVSEFPIYGLSENAAAGIGLCMMFLLVAAATVLFIRTGNQHAPYAYLEKELLETQYGVDGLIAQRRDQYKPTYDTGNLAGTVICILSIIPLFIGMAVGSDLFMVLMLSLTCALAGTGVYLFVRVGVIWAAFDKLSQQGDYSKKKKMESSSILGAISTAYWLLITAGYLAYSFVSMDWQRSWIIWPVAGVLYPAVRMLLSACAQKKA